MTLIDLHACQSADDAFRRYPDLALCVVFQHWSIEAYGELYLADLAPFPNLAARLPRMPSEDIQRHWTWFTGAESIAESAAFMHAVGDAYPRLTGRNLSAATVLDYGAGWGRMTRMLLQFIPGERVLACDADPASVDIFNELGFQSRCASVPVAPESLPYPNGSIDFIWLYSVLTHLPPALAKAVIEASAKALSPDGLLMTTIHPVEFWARSPLVRDSVEAEPLVQTHEREGIAHVPVGPYWGDTSMSTDYIARQWPELEIVDVTNQETDQVEVWLKHR